MASSRRRAKGRDVRGARQAKGRALRRGPQPGLNAIEELARQILRLQALTDYASGTTVNVGVVSGGTRRNVVPAEAAAGVDLRVQSKAGAVGEGGHAPEEYAVLSYLPERAALLVRLLQTV